MVHITKNKLIIEIETPFPCDLLHDFQEAIIGVLMLKDNEIDADSMKEWNSLYLLEQMLPTSEDYKKAFSE